MKLLLVVLFMFGITQAYGQQSFLKACRNELVQPQSIKNDLKWLKAFYKTRECVTLAQNISKIKSLSEIMLPTIVIDYRIKNSWTDQFPYQYGIFFSGIADLQLRALDIDREKVFLDLTMYRDFKNIHHITLTNQYAYFKKHNVCEILQLFPNLKTVSIKWNTLIKKENDNCLARSKVDGVIIRDVFEHDDEKKMPETKIIGIEHYSAKLKQLSRYPNLKYLGLTSYTNLQGKLQELSGRINITHFSMNSYGSRGISNLGYLSNLSYLSLTCVAEGSLAGVRCRGEPYLEDINFLRKLRWLTDLRLNHYGIKDLTPLENLKYLELVDLRGNNIERIPNLKNLTKLKVLNLGGNKLQNLSNIHHLENLQLLDASSNQISDFHPLTGLNKLTHLNISNNIFQTSFDSFKPPASLRVLALNGASPLKDYDISISPNEEFLEDAIIGSSHHFQDILTRDFEYFEDYEDSKTIYTPFISEGINLRNFENVEALSLRSNNFNNIPQLQYLKKLKYLDLDGNNIKTISKDVSLPEVLVLDLSDNKMEPFPALHQFPKLKKLDLIGNKIKTLESFATTQSLTLVSMDYNLLTNVSILAKPMYKNLRLQFWNNPIVDKKSHCPFKTPNEDLNYQCNIIVNKPELTGIIK